MSADMFPDWAYLHDPTDWGGVVGLRNAKDVLDQRLRLGGNVLLLGGAGTGKSTLGFAFLGRARSRAQAKMLRLRLFDPKLTLDDVRRVFRKATDLGAGQTSVVFMDGVDDLAPETAGSRASFPPLSTEHAAAMRAEVILHLEKLEAFRKKVKAGLLDAAREKSTRDYIKQKRPRVVLVAAARATDPRLAEIWTHFPSHTVVPMPPPSEEDCAVLVSMVVGKGHPGFAMTEPELRRVGLWMHGGFTAGEVVLIAREAMKEGARNLKHMTFFKIDKRNSKYSDEKWLPIGTIDDYDGVAFVKEDLRAPDLSVESFAKMLRLYDPDSAEERISRGAPEAEEEEEQGRKGKEDEKEQGGGAQKETEEGVAEEAADGESKDDATATVQRANPALVS